MLLPKVHTFFFFFFGISMFGGSTCYWAIGVCSTVSLVRVAFIVGKVPLTETV